VVYQPQQKTCEVGLRAKVLPVVSADRRFVKLHYAMTLTSVDKNIPLLPVQLMDGPDEFTAFIQQPRIQTLALDKTVRLPDGGTAVFYLGKTVVEQQYDYGPPILSKIPYLSRLFTNVGYGRETRDVYLMVTTRVIVND
jgi:type II secretory pathway component GspD/PulD (secretin)